MSDYYVYIVYKSDSVYVGKGRENRWKGSLKERQGDGCKIISTGLTNREALDLEDLTWLMLKEAKVELLNEFRPCTGGMYGRKHSEETKRIIGLANSKNSKVFWSQASEDTRKAHGKNISQGMINQSEEKKEEASKKKSRGGELYWSRLSLEETKKRADLIREGQKRARKRREENLLLKEQK